MQTPPPENTPIPSQLRFPEESKSVQFQRRLGGHDDGSEKVDDGWRRRKKPRVHFKK
jgi:hypothetical protein